MTGTAASGKYRHNVGGDFYNWCFAGNDDEYGDFRYCPGVDTQASFWLLNGSGGFNKLMQASTYGRQRDEVLQTASAFGAATFNGTLYGVGYSSTGEVGSGISTAATWPVTGPWISMPAPWVPQDNPAARWRAGQG